MKIKAAIARKAREPLEIEEVDLREPHHGEVLVKISATGICHTDISIMDGKNKNYGDFPIILGHEGAGIVVECGEGVTSVVPGDHILLAGMPECRKCKFCLSGQTNLCEELFTNIAQPRTPFSKNGRPINKFLHTGAFAEYLVTDEISVVKVRRDAPLKKICVAACSVTTGVGAAVFAAKIRPGSSVVVFGMGGIGINAVQGARFCGATKIIAVDPNPAKEAEARRFGATDFVNPALINEDIVRHLMGLTDGGADYAIEAVGHPEVIRQALACTRIGSGSCIVVGMLPDGAKLLLGVEDLGIGRSLRLSAAGDMRGRTDTPKLVDWYMDRKLMFDELISGTFGLEDINKAIAQMREGKVTRNVIVF